MEVQHADGSTIAVQVQGADRHGDGSRCGRWWGGCTSTQRCNTGLATYCLLLPINCTARLCCHASHSLLPSILPRWSLRVTVASAQPAAQQRPHLLQVLESSGAVHHDSSESEEEEDPADMQ